ncbi:MAG: hypothetical protein CL946_00260 [Ectothiorhodospiraceae bacterium]|nr:hypothetical protein [Ectothiorhodospiraceae bacterium]
MPIRTAIVYLFAFAALASAQDGDVCLSRPIIIQERVGDTIDKEERLYFNLFPNLDGFESAVCIPRSGLEGEYTLCITTTAEPNDVTIRIPEGALERLRVYLSRYEEVLYSCNDEETRELWDYHLSFFRSKKLIGRLPETKPWELTITTLEKEQQSGIVIHAAEDAVFITHPEEMDMLTQIPVQNTLHFTYAEGTAMGTGALISMGFGFVYGTIVGTQLRNSAKYKDEYPSGVLVGLVSSIVMLPVGLGIGLLFDGSTTVEISGSPEAYEKILPKLKSRMLLPHPPPGAWFR